jgi:coenzyme F420-reducing hydrogenase alpha subunit
VADDGRRTRTIRTGALARVEGEGAMRVTVRDGRVTEVQLRIYEPPRFFEALLAGRAYTEAPDITARICGICPIAYQTSAMNAMEDACGVAVDERVRLLRRLLYCGEWVESHALHVFMLHAPDFLGYEGAVQMAADHRDVVELGLRVRKAGNEILRVVGGRDVHPINVRVGGFYRAPASGDLSPLRERLLRAREDAVTAVRWCAGLDFPDVERDYELVALSRPDEYAIERGRIVSSAGLDAPAREWPAIFVEDQVPHSTALHCRIRERGPYLVGPLARYALSSDRLSGLARETAREAGLGRECRNPYMSIIVRAVETLYAIDEAIRIIDGYEPPDPPAAEVPPIAGVGHGVSEAPRGLLYHRYRIDAEGTIREAVIVPPTSQNQGTIEHDLAAVVERDWRMPREQLTLLCEQTIRNHDPCISCATHFLTLELDRG